MPAPNTYMTFPGQCPGTVSETVQVLWGKSSGVINPSPEHGAGIDSNIPNCHPHWNRTKRHELFKKKVHLSGMVDVTSYVSLRKIR